MDSLFSIKKCGFILLLSGFAISTQGQIKINPKIGVNASNMKIDTRELMAEARVGWNLGVDLRMGGGKILFIPGIHYCSFASDYTSNSPSKIKSVGIEQTNIQNIKIPFNIGINLTETGGLIDVWVKGGGSANFFAGVKKIDGSFSGGEEFSKVNYGLNFGVGIDVLVFTFDFSYELGQTNFFVSGDSRNNMLTVSAGIKL